MSNGYVYRGTGKDQVAREARPVSHGTRGGFQTHKNRGELPCIPCYVANSAYHELYRRRGKCAPGLGWPLVARRG